MGSILSMMPGVGTVSYTHLDVYKRQLSKDQVCELAVKALSCGIVTRGGGGDFPRNVMVSPLAGVEAVSYTHLDVYKRQ